MRTLISIGLVSTLTLLALAGPAAAHETARAIDFPSGERCYILTNDTEEPQFWRETNGNTEGGVSDSGLQTEGDDADMRYDDPTAWAVDCAAGA